MYNKEAEELKKRGIYIWVSDFRQICESTYRRLVLIDEHWLRGEVHGKSTYKIAEMINEDCAEGCDLEFLTDEVFKLNGDHYKIAVFEARNG